MSPLSLLLWHFPSPNVVFSLHTKQFSSHTIYLGVKPDNRGSRLPVAT